MVFGGAQCVAVRGQADQLRVSGEQFGSVAHVDGRVTPPPTECVSKTRAASYESGYPPAVTTPAGWYPDPDGSGGQRYWDGSTWTEHRAPAAQEPAGEHVGSHRAPEPEAKAESEPGPTAVINLDAVPSAPSEQATSVIRRPQQAFEPTSTASELTSATEPTSFGAGGTPQPSDPRRSLIVKFVAACAALLAVLVAVVIYGLFFTKSDDTTQASSGKTSTSKPAPATTSSDNGWGNSTESPSQSPSAPSGSGPQASDGGLTFAITGVENAPTVKFQDAPVEKQAQGEFLIVHMTVLNSGDAKGTFLATWQKLKAGGTTYNVDDQATAYLNGTWADLDPNGSADVAIAFDVPPGTSAESLEVHGEPTSTGVDVPLS
nr:DUF4352 domain-containing protein [Mycobacterium sp. OAS707]